MKNKYIFRRDFNKKQTAKFSKKIINKSWEYIYNNGSALQMYSYFQNQISYLCFREKQVKITYKKLSSMDH